MKSSSAKLLLLSFVLLHNLCNLQQLYAQAFQQATIAPFNTANFVTRVIDYDNDGDDDVIGSLAYTSNTAKLYRNNGNGTFTDVSLQTNCPSFNEINFSDLDKNGFTDIYWKSGDTIKAAFNNGSSFSTPSLSCGFFFLTSVFSEITDSTIIGFNIWDYNNDGVYDFIITTTQGTTARIWAQKGKINCSGCGFGPDTSSAKLLVTISNQINPDFKFADVNNDGAFDLLVCNGTNSGGSIGSGFYNFNYYLYLNSGNGSFSLSTNSGYSFGRGGGAWGFLGDFNNDGITDICSGAYDCCVGGNPLYVHYSSGLGSYSVSTTAMARSLNPYYFSATITDINLDRKTDIVWTKMGACYQTANLQCFLNNGNNTFSESAASLGINLGDGPYSCDDQYSTILDLNNDRKLDINIHNLGGRAVYNYTLLNTSTNNALKLKLNGCSSLREGWGSRIKYKTGGSWTYVQHNSYTNSNRSSSGYPFLILGMGASTIIDSLVVYWTSGSVSTQTNLTSGSYYEVKERASCQVNCNQVCIADITQNDTSICSGQTVTLTANNTTPLSGTLKTGLVGYWPFNGNANDESGNGNHGVVNGANLTSDRFGEKNKAYGFDGINDYIQTNCLGISGGESRTVTFWAKTNGINGLNNQNMNVVCYGSSASGANFEVALNHSCEGLTLDINDGVNTKSATTSDNSWRFFTIVFDNSLGNNFNAVLYYSNSILLTSTCQVGALTTINSNNMNPIVFGAYWNHLIRFFQGSIDDICIWNRALSSTEISQLYKGSRYLWSTGETTSSINVSPTVSTTYYCTITDPNGNSCRDSVRVSVNECSLCNGEIMASDTLICAGKETNLSTSWPSLDLNKTNRGKRFWVGYGHHQNMENGTNQQEMHCYFVSDSLPALINIYLWNNISNSRVLWKTISLLPNSIVSSGTFPKSDTLDARLFGIACGALPSTSTIQCGGEGLFKRGILIESDNPISAFVQSYISTNSGTSMLIPVDFWGNEYLTANSNQVYADNCYSWVYVIADKDNTKIRITTSVQSKGSSNSIPGMSAGLSYDMVLNSGEIYQFLAKDNLSSVKANFTGTRVRSIQNSEGVINPIAVFTGSSRTTNPQPCGSGGGDADLKQCFAIKYWGTKYLTAPTIGKISDQKFMINSYKVLVKDSLTVLKRNGIVIPYSQLSADRTHYFFPGDISLGMNAPQIFEATKPIMVAQFMTGGGCLNGNTDGDPEMMYLTPIDQGIKRANIFTTGISGISSAKLSLIVHKNGVSSLRIDNQSLFDFVATHPGDTNYRIVLKNINSLNSSVNIQCDLPFVGLTYGLGQVVSYGVNIGRRFSEFLGNTMSNSYLWSTGDTSSSIIVSPSQSKTYYCTVSDGVNSCTDSVRVNVLPIPKAGLISGSDTVCLGTPVLYQASGDAGGIWKSENPSIAYIDSTAGALNAVTAGNTNLQYIVSSPSCGTDTAVKNIQVSTCLTLINLKAFIQGYYANMNYLQPVLYYSGIDGSTPYVSDTITVEIHDGQDGSLIGEPVKSIIQLDGTASVRFPIVIGSHYIVLKHRNALETWSAVPVPMGADVSYDFTTEASKAYGSNQADMGNGKYAIWSGDLNQDGAIESTDFFLMENDILSILFGYHVSDINGDGEVESADYYLMENNILRTIFLQRPF
jgi:hypothetical protein